MAPATNASNDGMPTDDEPGSYAGWYIGAAIIVAIFAVGVGLWFVYHP